jgi:hypothetical protein
MRLVRVCLILPFLLFPVMAQEPETGPSNEKAKKSFKEGLIPHTSTIDADGVLQEEHVGDASIEGKLKKLLAQAQDR